MPASAAYTFDPATRLDPVFDPDAAREIHVNLADGTYLKGKVLAESPSVPGTFLAYDGTLRAAPTVAPTLTTPTGGALAAGDYVVGYTYLDAAGRETALGTTATTTAALNDVVHAAALTPLPAGVASVNWYMSVAAGSLVLGFVSNNNGAALDLALPASGAKQPPASPTFRTTGKAKLVLRYACVAASGAITVSSEVPGATVPSVPAFRCGAFRTEELAGLDDAALRDLNATVVLGDLTTGIVQIP